MRKCNSVSGRVHSVETLGALEGPGLRFVVFLQGCPIRCAYCHNPDTWEMDSGKLISARDQVQEILRYKNYLSGGVTISGGEPLSQAEFTHSLIDECHIHHLHTAIDTSGAIPLSLCRDAVTAADLILLDIKSFDHKKAKSLCGIDMSHAWAILDYCQSIGKPVWIRHVLVPGITVMEKNTSGTPLENEENFRIANTELVAGIHRLKTYSCIERIDLLPFHKLGEFKWENLSIPFSLHDVDEPSEHVIAWCRNLVSENTQPGGTS